MDFFRKDIISVSRESDCMKYISFLIKPASSLCNMRCRYCFYYDVAEHREVSAYGIMEEDTMHALIDKALGLGEDAHITFAFQGGEPTMAGLSYFTSFCEYAEKHKTKQNIQYALQTNGTRIDESWCALFKKYIFLIGVSLDGYKEIHDYFRMDPSLKGTFSHVFKTVQLLRQYEIPFNILTVLTSQLSKHPEKLFRFYKQNQLSYVQLIPCLPGLDENENKNSLHPKEFASFYKTFFRLWLAEYKKGNYISITLFDNIIPMFKGIRPQQCGMLGYCTPQFVIESNGDVYPCDFYVLDAYRCGNIKEDSLIKLVKTDAMQKFLKEERRECTECRNCPFVNICHKNCKRLNITYYTKDYCGYKDFLMYAKDEMMMISYSL